MALTTRYRFADAPTSAIVGDSSLGWTTTAGTLAAAGTSLSVTSSSPFPADGEFDVIIGARNTTTGVWTNAEVRHVTAVSGTTWTVSTGALSHASGESISHVLTAEGIQHNPGALADSGDIPYLNASGRMDRLAAPVDGVYEVTWTTGVPAWSSATASGGGNTQAYAAKSADYTINATTDYCIECTANSFVVTLPTAVGIVGQMFQIKDSGTGTITLNTTSAQTIDGHASGVVTLGQFDNIMLVSNGANWIIL